MSDLRYCPFCNGMPKLLNAKNFYKIKCNTCGGNVKSKSLSDCISLWNNDDNEQDLDTMSEIERLQEINNTLRNDVNRLVRRINNLQKELQLKSQ